MVLNHKANNKLLCVSIHLIVKLFKHKLNSLTKYNVLKNTTFWYKNYNKIFEFFKPEYVVLTWRTSLLQY